MQCNWMRFLWTATCVFRIILFRGIFVEKSCVRTELGSDLNSRIRSYVCVSVFVRVNVNG